MFASKIKICQIPMKKATKYMGRKRRFCRMNRTLSAGNTRNNPIYLCQLIRSVKPARIFLPYGIPSLKRKPQNYNSVLFRLFGNCFLLLFSTLYSGNFICLNCNLLCLLGLYVYVAFFFISDSEGREIMPLSSILQYLYLSLQNLIVYFQPLFQINSDFIHSDHYFMHFQI